MNLILERSWALEACLVEIEPQGDSIVLILKAKYMLERAMEPPAPAGFTSACDVRWRQDLLGLEVKEQL